MFEKIIVSSLPNTVIEDAVYSINQSNPNTYTHNYFKYPCKFIPEIPRWAINSYLGKKKDAVVLDPFSGSGTTLLEASLAGCIGIGGEIDEVAKLITKVKTTKLSNQEIAQIEKIVTSIIDKIEINEYSETEVTLPAINNLTHWFEDNVLNELGYIYHSICLIENKNIKNFLLICMASIIKRVSNCDDISPKPYVSNKIKKKIPSVPKTFNDVVSKNILSMIELKDCNLNKVEIMGDAKHLDIKNDSVDLAVTSPPYINAFDYVRTLRLENLWLNMATEDELRNKKKLYMGTESINVKIEREKLEILERSDLLNDYFQKIRAIDERRALIVKRFFEDMEDNLNEVYRVLKKNSYYVIVIGNSTIRKTNVESWRILKDLSVKMGFNYVTHFGYEIQNPYIRIPRGSKGGKISIDHILVLQK